MMKTLMASAAMCAALIAARPAIAATYNLTPDVEDGRVNTSTKQISWGTPTGFGIFIK